MTSTHEGLVGPVLVEADDVPATGPVVAAVPVEPTAGFDSIDTALAEIAAGRMVVVLDDEDRENEGDLIFAAEKATPELMAFLVRHSSGFVCAPLTGAECDRLSLPPMASENQDKHGTAYTVTVDAREGGTTGISAADRARTCRLLADPRTRPADFTRPGHVVPLRARDGGVLERDGHTEAAVDLARLAGLRPAGVICEIVSEDDPLVMARTDELRRFAAEHELAIITIADLIAWRRHNDHLVERGPAARVPTSHGVFRAHGYTAVVGGAEHVALVSGDPAGTEVPVRIHSECAEGDTFRSLQCGCGRDLGAGLEEIDHAERGVLVYLRHPSADDLPVAARILADLGVQSARLLFGPSDDEQRTGAVIDALTTHGIAVSAQTTLTADPVGGTATA